MTNKIKINLTVEVDTGKCDYAAESVGNPKQVTFRHQREFTKSDLKDGMVLHCRNGERRLYFEGKLIYFRHPDYIEMSCDVSLYTKDLNYINDQLRRLDIVRVFYMDRLVWSRG